MSLRAVGRWVGALAVIWLVMLVLVGVFGSSNLIYGDAHQYGTVRVPGHATLTLPKGDADVAEAVYVVGRGNETPDLPIPEGVSASLRKVGGSATATLERSVGTSGNAMSADANSQRRLWVAHVPAAGQYAVITHGSLAPLGVNGQLWFGHGPPISGGYVPLVALILAMIALLIWLAVGRLRGGRSTADGFAD